jgi:integrase
MLYKRGGIYWYKFHWSVKSDDGTREGFLIRKSARTGNKKKAGEAEDEHRRALRLGQIHPADPWPAPKPQAPATRNIPLTPRTREMLLARRELMVGPKDAKRRRGDLRFVFPGDGNSGHLVTVQHAHEKAASNANLQPFEFYCWRHTFGTRCAESGMDKFTLARLMGHSSPRVAERYYIHVTEPHVMTGFERFVSYQTTGIVNAIKLATDRLQ